MTKPTEIKAAELVAKVRHFAMAQPDKKAGCNYVRVTDETDVYENGFNDGNLAPCCIIGHALHSLGVPLTRLMDEEGVNAAGVINPEGLLRGPDQAWLNIVQRLQDDGETWGDAVKHADIRQKRVQA